MAGGVFVGQHNISLIRQLAVSSNPEDPGCSGTHAAPLAAGRADTLPQPVNVCRGAPGPAGGTLQPAGCTEEQPGAAGRRTVSERGPRPQSLRFGGQRIRLLRSAEVVSPTGTDEGDTVQTAETPPPLHFHSTPLENKASARL